MKHLLLTLCSLATFSVISQAVLPTSHSFTGTTLPSGWTENGTAFYTASGNTPPAMKLDGTGDYLQIYFTGNPGQLSYYLTGNGFSGGTFEVQESVNGSSWTTLHSFTTAPDATYTQYTDTPQITSHYIRFFYTQKVAGNIGLDDVMLAEGAAGPSQEIEVVDNTTVLLTGATKVIQSAVGTPVTATLTLKNEGTVQNLDVSSMTLSGVDAADFQITGGSSTQIGPNGTYALTVQFTPSVAGSRHAALQIASNDADEALVTINLYGIGGNLATEPTSQAQNLTFQNVKTYRLDAQFAAASTPSEAYIVLRKTGTTLTEVPVDGQSYDRGDYIGGAQVVYVGTNLAFVPNYIHANTSYTFAVFTLNGPMGYENYLTTAPLKATAQTPATMQPTNYYAGINMLSPTFVTDLHNLVNPHDEQFYSNYATLMVAKFVVRDTTDNRRVITCSYSGEHKIYTEPFDFTSNGFSREHSYCHNWMPTNPADALPEYNDYHHLYPVNQDLANAVRSNYPLGEVVTVGSSYLQAKFGQDENGHSVYEPRDAHKGAVARAIMYEAIAYDGVSGNDWSFPDFISGSIPYGQDQYVLKKWHLQNPPSKMEIARNDFIDSLQGNRNPFIDEPTFACYINFSNMNYETLGCEAELTEALSNALILFPNPSAQGTTNVHVDGSDIIGVRLIDASGREVLMKSYEPSKFVTLDLQTIAPGCYTIHVQTIHGDAYQTLIH